MNQSELLKLGVDLLKKEKIEEAEIKAKRLLEFILKQSREEFIRNSGENVLEIQEQEYIKRLEEIIKGKPLQYITHNQEFMGLNFYVDENVLIPQPDTETIVEQAIKFINIIKKNNNIAEQTRKYNCTSRQGNSKEKIVNQKQEIEELKDKEKIQILDLCTGSGAIAISIAKYIQDVLQFRTDENIENGEENKICQSQIKRNNKQCICTKIIASDISNKALEVAKQNAIQNKVENIQFIQSNMFFKLKNHRFDMIISNPPYIETDVIPTLSNEVQQEPKIALDGGTDGLKFYNVILKEASKYVKANGYVLFEIGYNQGEKIFDLWKQLKNENKCELEAITEKPIKDLNGNDRVMIFQKL